MNQSELKKLAKSAHTVVKTKDGKISEVRRNENGRQKIYSVDRDLKKVAPPQGKAPEQNREGK